MTDAVKCSTENDAGSEIGPCIPNCSPFLRREMSILKPKVVVAFGPRPKPRAPRRDIAGALEHASVPDQIVVHWSGATPAGKIVSVYQNFPKLEDTAHDVFFDEVASILGRAIPPNFRATRAQIYREYF